MASSNAKTSSVVRTTTTPIDRLVNHSPSHRAAPQGDPHRDQAEHHNPVFNVITSLASPISLSSSSASCSNSRIANTLSNLDPNLAQKIRSSSSDFKLLENALADCSGRFLVNLPEQLLSDHVHLYFQIQEAFWWYDDFWVEKNMKSLPKLSLKEFGLLIVSDCPVLRQYLDPRHHESFMLSWRKYCRTIPLRGAIILDEDLNKCLMVQGWRGGQWMFPRGKMDEEEEDATCACREVFEEVGAELSDFINEQVFIEKIVDDQPLKLFVIPGIPLETKFQPQKRKEIGDIKWVNLDRLPGWKSELGGGYHLEMHHYGGHNLKFWNVQPFARSLQGWVKLLREGVKYHNAHKQSPWDLLVMGCNEGAKPKLRYDLPPNVSSKTLLHLQNPDIKHKGRGLGLDRDSIGYSPSNDVTHANGSRHASSENRSLVEQLTTMGINVREEQPLSNKGFDTLTQGSTSRQSPVGSQPRVDWISALSVHNAHLLQDQSTSSRCNKSPLSTNRSKTHHNGHQLSG
eukprot:GHVN01060223.1.p1 GENE.GHVN01060223.1~~GHVN01060223.1.p1  ORF type:complete len:569 (+),score=90.97 GHVN01060223.1:167-1708(+)